VFFIVTTVKISNATKFFTELFICKHDFIICLLNVVEQFGDGIKQFIRDPYSILCTNYHGLEL
jgi:hypothetical protein